MSGNTDAVDLAHRLPTQDEIACAAQAVTALADARGGNDVLAIHREDGESVRLAPAIADLVLDLLGGVASGHTVTLVPVGTLLTTQQAADILSVSRPHLSKMLKSGKIPFVSVGAHRRILHADLMAYIDRRDAGRRVALDELARLGQEFDAS
ncbi:MAG: helix-turn-helix domain-containing protein [Paracoccaceae bacterium]|nr:helix-turn-helix domain-containing protein [Paracoccaceae bacterium]MDE2912025.1 helix-turn-helix domain-containing protein [Paracoccaceae bacterium]